MQINLTMSQKEVERLKTLTRIKSGELTISNASESLRISERHMYRILKRYSDEGDAGIIHRSRGRQSNNRLPQTTYDQALKLYKEKYSDFGPTFFSEKLEFEHDIFVSRQTLTRWLRKKGLLLSLRKKRPHRKKRPRRDTIGSLVQFDGSHHDWFEGRAPACCLLCAVDDASGQIFLQFAETEDTESVLSFFKKYIELFGIPAQIYTDFHTIYYNQAEHLTQYERALKTLNIEPIYAHSPQAKGRVERGNRTHQDRLIKSLRLKKISSIQDANKYLLEEYIAHHNKLFANSDSLQNIHRPSDGIDLDAIFCFETKRTVYNDYTIMLNSQYIQLHKLDAPLPPPKSKVIVRRYLDNSLHVLWNNNELKHEIFNNKPKPKQRVQLPRKPSPNHPWRKLHQGLSGKQYNEATKLELLT
jgi:transposase